MYLLQVAASLLALGFGSAAGLRHNLDMMIRDGIIAPAISFQLRKVEILLGLHRTGCTDSMNDTVNICCPEDKGYVLDWKHGD